MKDGQTFDPNEDDGETPLRESAAWLIPAALAGIAIVAVAQLIGKHPPRDDSSALVVPSVAAPSPPDTAVMEEDERMDPSGVAPLILVLELLGVLAGVIALAFVIPPAYYAALVVFGPVSLLGLIVIIYHYRIRRAAKQNEP